MSTFTALNVEPEDVQEEDIDDTKEIQIEEAFKLYQNALKLHSQGPQYYAAAEEAYLELFQSEVFKYPEVVSEFGNEQFEDTQAAPILPEISEPLPLIAGNAADSATNSLPQLVYLSYKNRAQFILDVARHELQESPASRKEIYRYYYTHCSNALNDSANALERDDTDLDLWKKTARISETLSSLRLARFCLESVLAGDNEGSEQTIDLSGLDEAFASGELESLLRTLQDDLSTIKQAPVKAKGHLLVLLRQSNDAYPFLPSRSDTLEYLDSRRKPYSFETKQSMLCPETITQESLGQTILEALKDYENGADPGVGPLVIVKLQSDSKPDANDQIDIHMDDVSQTNVPEQEKRYSPIDITRSPASFHSAQDEIQTDKEETSQPATADKQDSIPDAKPIDDRAAETTLTDQKETPLPTRKRSSTAAGNEEPESRTKSKRLRARESMLELAAQEEEIAQDFTQYHRQQLARVEDADQGALTYLDKLLTKVGVVKFGSLEDVRNIFWREDAVTESPTNVLHHSATEVLLTDMRQSLMAWTDEKSSAILVSHGSRDAAEKSTGLSLFLRHLKASMPKEAELTPSEGQDQAVSLLTSSINSTSTTIHEAALLWLLTILTSPTTNSANESSYMTVCWSDTMQDIVTQIVLRIEEYIVEVLRKSISSFEILDRSDLSYSHGDQEFSPVQMVEFVQTIFELSLDMFVSSTGPESQVEEETRILQEQRLERWAKLAADYSQVGLHSDAESDLSSPLILRFLWCSVALITYATGADKAYVAQCLSDLRERLDDAGRPVITLPNNKAMSQISIAAIDQQMSRLSTLDFFMGIFDSDNSDPVMVIEKLEPILIPDLATTTQTLVSDVDTVLNGQSQVEKLREFLDSGDASLRLFLWKRLQNAYTAISYTPKVVSCLLRSVETIAHELQSARYLQLSDEERPTAMFQWLREADEHVARVLSKVSTDTKAFDVLDEEHLQSSISAVVTCLKVIHGFVLFDDSVRVGQTPSPTLRTTTSVKQFDKSRDKLREMYVRLWTLLYYLLKEATIQIPGEFTQIPNELAEFLRNVHNALGQRQYCRHCNKLFVKLVRSELLSLGTDADFSEDIAQVLYDMYQVRLSVGFGDVDHGCSPEPLEKEKKTTASLVPIIMSYARKMTMQNLLKSELKNAMEKVQQAVGQVKTSPSLSYNKKAISAYLKSSIDPRAVYESFKGLGDLVTKDVFSDYAQIAATGWYQLQGKMSLARYRSVKRVNPTPTDDLDVASTFFRNDLEHDINSWESWYRLAQVFDAKIEDNLIWNSTKLNESRAEIAILERSAINAYTMAITMTRAADDLNETVQKISEMYSDFATRLYASSRPPLNMEAFNTDKHMRHISNSRDQTMSKMPFIIPFRPYQVWSLAAHLYRRKYTTTSKEWLCHYTLGKCLWKMYQLPENTRSKHPVTIDQVLEAFSDAVEAVPKKEKASDYILEPHFKIVSVVHKMVHRGHLPASRGVEYLQVTQFARGVHLGEDEQGRSEWDVYVLDVLKKLGNADKSNWHHRIIARAAHVVYDDQPNIAGALGAKHQFTQQIFTKTMTMQVWKPEYERPGRHYVYTGRYLEFFVHLLDQLNDRASLEMLVRRIRRKTTDFLDHTKIWEATATTYLKLLRRMGKVPDGHERALFDKISFEEWSKISEKLEEWAQDPTNTSPFFDVMQDAIELKKLNNSLMKGPAIDDLIGDAYACIYERFVSQLPPDETATQTKNMLPSGTFINLTTETAPTGDDNLDRMRLNNLLSGQTDSNVGAVAATATPPAELVRIPTPSKPGRQKTITRREVQRKAEAIIAKQPPQPKTPTLSKRPFIEIPVIKRDSGTPDNAQSDADKEMEFNEDDDEDVDDSRMQSRKPSMADTTRDSAEAEDKDADNEEENENENENENEEEGNEEDGEGDDDADDESELTELEDVDEDDAGEQDGGNPTEDRDENDDMEVQDSQEAD